MAITAYVKLVRRNWLVITNTVLLAALGSLVVTLVQTPQYKATAKLFVSVQEATSVQDLSLGATFTQQVVKSYANVVSTPTVLTPVIRQLHLPTTASKLSTRVSADAPLNTVVIEISATDADASTAANIANAVGRQLIHEVDVLTPTPPGGTAPVKLTIVQEAAAPVVPASPNVGLNLAVGILLGLLAGILTANIRQALDTRIRTDRDIALVSDSPILGALAFDPEVPRRPLTTQYGAGTPRAEAFRSLRTNLHFISAKALRKGVAITSSVEGEGKTTTAANLGIAMADAGSRVILIDADLRRPKLGTYLELDGTVGLSDVLIADVAVDEAIQKWGQSGNLSVLPAGRIPPNPSELLQSAAMKNLLRSLRSTFDTIILDTPPLLPVSDAAIVARRVGGALVVCSARGTTRHQLRGAVGSLRKVDANVLGFVMSMLPIKGPDAYEYGAARYAYESERETQSDDDRRGASELQDRRAGIDYQTS